MANPLAVPAPLALIPYAERFLDGRRVVIFGDATSGLAEEAAERGARLVHVIDHDPARVAEAVATAPRGLSFAVLRDGGDGGLRDGAFDTCLISDLSRFPDPKALLTQARRLLAASGVLIAATPRVEGGRGESLRGKGGPLNYYDFYDLLARQFKAVTMAGQVPFQGYALVNFALDGDPEVTVDASLTDAIDREPIAYVALASDRRVPIDTYAIVQLPGQDDENDDRAAPVAAPPRDDGRLVALQAEVDSLTAARRTAETRLAEEQRRGAELGRALNEAGALPRQLELRLTEEARRAEMLAAQISRNQEATERAQREMRALQEQAKQATRTLAEAHARQAQFTQREETLTRKLRELEAQPRGVDPARLDELRQRQQAAEQERDANRIQFDRERDASRQQLERERDTARQQVEAARQQVEAARQQLESERDTLRQQAARETETLRQQLERDRTTLERDRATLQREREAVRQQAEHEQGAWQQQVALLQSQLDEARQRTSALRAEATQAQTDQAEQVADLSTAESNLRSLAREVAQHKAEIERRGAMVRELLEALEHQQPGPLNPVSTLDQERLAYLDHELAQTRSRADHATALADRREAELTAARAHIATLQNAADAHEAARREAARQVAQLEAARQVARDEAAQHEDSSPQDSPPEAPRQEGSFEHSSPESSPGHTFHEGSREHSSESPSDPPPPARDSSDASPADQLP